MNNFVADPIRAPKALSSLALLSQLLLATEILVASICTIATAQTPGASGRSVLSLDGTWQIANCSNQQCSTPSRTWLRAPLPAVITMRASAPCAK